MGHAHRGHLVDPQTARLDGELSSCTARRIPRRHRLGICRLDARNVAEYLEPEFLGAVVRTSIWSGAQPPAGVSMIGKVWREKFGPVKNPDRVDSENLAGTNLER